MEFKTIEDAIHFAIQKEEASARFYKDIAEHMQNSSTRIIFEVFSRTELQHKANLELELMKLGKTVKLQPCSIPELPDQTYVEVDEDAANMSFVDALQIAIGKEKSAFMLYVGMMAKTSDPQLRQILMELSEEEMRHVIQFENEYNSVISRKK